MDWIGWLVVMVACAVVVGLVREGRRRRAAGRDDAAAASHRAAAKTDRGRFRGDAQQVDQRFVGYGGG